jgi:cytochrome c oxidase cbb3-type subunit 3
MAKAEIEKEEYLKTAASKVDENTVTLLTDAAALAEGRKLFSASCSPCHGAEAQGVVGPNLTDDYWLHKGSVKDVFKTIKYGVQEKGMKSWKDDFSPVQIAELASYIKSLHGTKPAGAKEPQGELFKDDAQAASGAPKTQDKKLVVN